MLRSPVALVLLSFVLVVARPFSAAAWQAPSDLPDTPRLTIDGEAVDLTAGEEIVGDPPTTNEPQPAGSTTGDEPSQTASPPRRSTWAKQPDVAAPTPVEEGDEPQSPQPSVDTTHLKATIFKGIEPGHTPVEELKKLWGEPQASKPGPNGAILTFVVEPFPKIDATIRESHVSALVVYMAQPVPPAAVVEQLGLAGIATVDVLDRNGRKVGEHFPERGVTLVFGQDADKENIARVLLEPLRAESFLLRVKRDREHRWQRNLNDLEIALRLDERDHRAWWLKAEALGETGDDAAAATAAERAIALDASVPTYQLTAARLLANLGAFDVASTKARAVLEDSTATPILKARAALLLGDLLADAPQHKFDEALKLHQQAIDLALPMATDRNVDMRRAAKHTLMEAHLAIAEDIARGRWQKKDAIAPQWLARSRAIADELIASGDGDATVLLDHSCASLAATTWLDGKVDPTPAIRQVQADARAFCAECDDALFTQCVSWKLAKALVDAVDIERTRSNSEKAIAYGTAAQEELDKLTTSAQHGDEAQFQLARLAFLLGSIEAVQRNDHAAAVKWFDKATERLARPEPDTDLAETARRGEWLVSMGVSYWQQGDQAQGLKLTELGANLIESANREGAVGEEALATPYRNLAFMHQTGGHEEKAQEFAQLAAQIDASKSRR